MKDETKLSAESMPNRLDKPAILNPVNLDNRFLINEGRIKLGLVNIGTARPIRRWPRATPET